MEVLKEITDEERVHAGKFLRILKALAPDEEKLYAEKAKEVEEEIKKPEKNEYTSITYFIRSINKRRTRPGIK
jgi:rubrerythrin